MTNDDVKSIFYLIFHSFFVLNFFFLLSSRYFACIKMGVGSFRDYIFKFVSSVKLSPFSVSLGQCGIWGGLALCAYYIIILGPFVAELDAILPRKGIG